MHFSDRADEAIALADDGLNEARLIGIVAEGLADFTDGSIDAVLGIDEHFAAPEVFGNFAAGDDIAFAGGEEDEQLHRLSLELDEPGRRGVAGSGRNPA